MNFVRISSSKLPLSKYSPINSPVLVTTSDKLTNGNIIKSLEQIIKLTN